MAFRKGPERVSKFRNSSQLREKTEVERPRKRNFFLNFWLFQRGGGRKFLQKLQKLAKNFQKASCSEFAVKNFKSPKNRFLQFLQDFPTPPLWKSQKFKKKFRFLGRSTSDFPQNWEEIRNFDTLFMAFSKSHFFELSVIFLGRIPPISLPEVEHFLCKIRTFSAIWWLDKRPNGRPQSLCFSYNNNFVIAPTKKDREKKH